MEDMLKIFALALRQKASEVDGDEYHLRYKYEGMAGDLEGVIRELNSLKEE